MNFFPQSRSETRQEIGIDRAVDQLADLLAETREVRELIRTAQDLRSDPEVIRIAHGIRDLKIVEGDNKQSMLDTLQQERENRPSVKQFRQAEINLRELFKAVDKIISIEAGMNFSENARVNIQLWGR